MNVDMNNALPENYSRFRRFVQARFADGW